MKTKIKRILEELKKTRSAVTSDIIAELAKYADKIEDVQYRKRFTGCIPIAVYETSNGMSAYAAFAVIELLNEQENNENRFENAYRLLSKYDDMTIGSCYTTAGSIFYSALNIIIHSHKDGAKFNEAVRCFLKEDKSKNLL